MLGTMSVDQRVDGRWAALLQAAHVPAQVLNKRHQACPFCGGKDRFRFADKGKGLWVCTDCTAGSYMGGMQFLQRHLGHGDLTETARWIHDYYDGNPAAAAITPIKRTFDSADMTEHERRRRIQKMQGVWDGAHEVRPGDPVDLYLRRRVPGLTSIDPSIRCHPALEYWERPVDPNGRPVLIGRYPTMIVRGFDVHGNLVQVHKTYLTPDGQKAPVTNVKKTDVGVGSNSFALRLMDVEGDELGVGEGIETAYNGGLMMSIPAWACHSASILANFEIPHHLKGRIRKLCIFSDNDPKIRRDGSRWNPGAEAAQKLAERMRKERVRTMIIRSVRAGEDLADIRAA